MNGAPGQLYTFLANEVTVNAQCAAHALDEHARTHFTGAAHGVLLALLALRHDEAGAVERDTTSQAWLVVYIEEETRRVGARRVTRLAHIAERQRRR